MRRHIDFVQFDVPHYRVKMFDRLAALLDDADLVLRVRHVRAQSDLSDREWSHPATHLGTAEGLSRIAARRATATSGLVIVQQEVKRLENPELLLRQQAGGTPMAMFGQGTTPTVSWGGGQALRRQGWSGAVDPLKRWLSRQVHWWFAYNEVSADVVRQLGYPDERITDVRNSIDVVGALAFLADEQAMDAASLRADLGLDGPVAVYCGRLYADKRITFLVEAADEVRRRTAGFTLLVVGDGPLRGELEAAAASRPWIRLVGARYGLDKWRHLQLADVTMLPGAVGLSILDAHVTGAPLVASRSSDHGPEIGYLEDGVDGLLADDGGDPVAYGVAVAELLADGGRLAAMQGAARRKAGEFSQEDMAARFAEGIQEALAAPRRERT